jgi:four helix bundle protein
MDELEPGADLRKRTKQFALRIMRLCEKLPARPVGRVIANQLLRCGTSVGANYRAVCRSRSTADFVSKLGVVLEEADESAYWLEIGGRKRPSAICETRTFTQGSGRMSSDIRRIPNNSVSALDRKAFLVLTS